MRIEYLKDVEAVSAPREGDAGYDLRASGIWVTNLDGDKKEITADTFLLEPGERLLIKTGIRIALPKNTWGNIRDRSGLAYKQGFHCLAGVIDCSYRGEIGVVAMNLGTKTIELRKNDRVAQLVVTPYLTPPLEVVDSLDETERDSGGFGSTGR